MCNLPVLTHQPCLTADPPNFLFLFVFGKALSLLQRRNGDRREREGGREGGREGEREGGREREIERKSDCD